MTQPENQIELRSNVLLGFEYGPQLGMVRRHYTRKHSEICRALKMPVPMTRQRIEAEDVFAMSKFPGVYFCWRHGRCDYVGKSINVPTRLRGHSIICPRDQVTFLEMPPPEMCYAELFYIWLLRPKYNKVSAFGNVAIET